MKDRAQGPGKVSEEEMKRLMDAYSGAVLGVCRVILGDWDAARDMAQETFLKAWRTGNIRRESEKAWLIRVAVNTCRDELRSLWCRHVDRSRPVDELPLPAPEAPDNDVMNDVARLPRKLREVIVLHYWQDMSADEIAGALDISRSQVYRRLDSARRRLRIDMEGGSDEK